MAGNSNGRSPFAKIRGVLANRISIILIGYFAACLAISLTLSTAVAIKMPKWHGLMHLGSIAFGFTLMYLVPFAVILLPSLLAIMWAEYAGARSAAWYCGGGMLLGAATTVFIPAPLGSLAYFSAGIVGGFTYWLVAGRTAGGVSTH